MFVHLIRTNGRHPRYVRFLEVLCACRGKAVRTNQWRVARLLLEEAPELLLSLDLEADGTTVTVSGQQEYFPKLAENGGSMELCAWLDSAEEVTADYFEAVVSLYSALVRGRNLRTTPTLQRLLPYSLVRQLIIDTKFHEKHLNMSRQFVAIARDLWVDNDKFAAPLVHPASVAEAHPPLVYVKTVRVWRKVPAIAENGVLSSRYNLDPAKAPDWSQFNALKAFAIGYISKHPSQNGKKIATNYMILELVKLMHALINTGFYKSVELGAVIGPLLSLLDGRQDVTGRPSDGVYARYEPETTITINTVVMMQCKEVLCQIFQLICTVRLDVRLSLFLGMYHKQRTKHIASQRTLSPTGTPSVVDKKKLSRSMTGTIVEVPDAEEDGFGHLDFDRIFEVLQMGMLKAESVTMKAKLKWDAKVTPYSSTMESDARQGKDRDLTAILIDLTYYKSPQLVSAALGLLVRQFEQRKVLEDAARKVQILVKPAMCNMYSTFDGLLSQLTRLAERRRLFDDEPYRAIVLLGHLTARCYEMTDGEDDQDEEIEEASTDFVHKMNPRQVSRASDRQSRASERRFKRSSSTLGDHTAGIYLQCVGKATGKLNSETLKIMMLEPDCPPIFASCRLQLLGNMYDVAGASDDEITLTKPLALPVDGVASDKIKNGESDVMWLFCEQRVGEPNPDMQLLLYNMNAHTVAQKLLRLPIKRAKADADLPYREVILATYRLLKAMCMGFKVTQMALLSLMPFMSVRPITVSFRTTSRQPTAWWPSSRITLRAVCK